jgi:hypothetical protein
VTVSKSEESQSQTHAACSQKIKLAVTFLLYQDAPYKHGNEFAALKDHLCGVIKVTQ